MTYATIISSCEILERGTDFAIVRSHGDREVKERPELTDGKWKVTPVVKEEASRRLWLFSSSSSGILTIANRDQISGSEH